MLQISEPQGDETQNWLPAQEPACSDSYTLMRTTFHAKTGQRATVQTTWTRNFKH
jgi:hypothetical protein